MLRVLIDHPDRGLVLQVVVEELGGDVVLDHLVLEHPETGLLHRQLGELEGALQSGHHHRPDDLVDLPLVEPAEAVRRRRGAEHEPVEAVGLRGIDGLARGPRF